MHYFPFVFLHCIDFELYSVYHSLERAPKYVRLMRITRYVSYSTDVTVTSPTTKTWSSAKLWQAPVYGGQPPMKNLHSFRMSSQKMLTNSGLAGETQRNILYEIIILYSSPWLLLGISRKLINLLFKRNTAVQSVVLPEESHKRKRFHKSWMPR